MGTVKIVDNLLVIHEGNDFYDTRCSFEIDKLIKVVEDVGVKGGHVGWSFCHKKLDSDGNLFEAEYMMGRKVKPILEEVKELIDSGELNLEYEKREGMKQRCF